MADALDDPRLTLAGLIQEVSSGLRLAFERALAVDGDLTVHRFEVLLRLARSDGRRLRLSDLAAQMMLTRSGLTRLVDGLEDDGLVERRSCPTDGRGVFAQLTPAGLTRISAAVTDHLCQLDDQLLAPLTTAEQGQLAAILRKVRDHVHPDAVLVTPNPDDRGRDRASGS